MLAKINPLSTSSWQSLKSHFSEMKKTSIRELFVSDPNRFGRYNISFDDILFDYSKNRINDQTLQLLLQLAGETKVKEAIAAMFNGDIINETEHRSVLHIALRNFSKNPVYSQGNNVMPEVKKVLRKMKIFCD